MSWAWSLARMTRYVAQSKRLEQLKQHDELCAQSFQGASYLMFFNGKPLARADGREQSIKWSSIKDVESCCDDVSNSSALLGIDESTSDDTALFACAVKDESAITQDPNLKFIEMRRAIMTFSTKEAAFVSRGYTLLNWLNKEKFCSTCTSPMKRNAAGTMLTCSKPCSKGNLYPVTHPVAITRVVDAADEKVLLVRQPRHPKGMFSCVAGFMEAGESLEDTVRREIAEEVGIVVGKVEYFDSQTWPLPQNSLMLACVTKAMPGSDKLDIDTTELEEARWFTRAEISDAYNRIVTSPGLLAKNENNELLIPPSGAIAHHLLKNWIGL